MRGSALIPPILSAALFMIDHTAKEYAEKLKNGGKTTFFDGRLVFRRAVNSGFLLNKMDNRRKLVLTVSYLVFFPLLAAYIFILAKPSLKYLRIGFAILFAGAAGNVYDRWKRGYVVDYLELKPIDRIIFNLADVYVVVGALITIVEDLIHG